PSGSASGSSRAPPCPQHPAARPCPYPARPTAAWPTAARPTAAATRCELVLPGHAVPPASLRLVELLVGQLVQLGRAPGRVGDDLGHAEAAGDGHALVLEAARGALDDAAELLADGGSVVAGDLGEDEGELLSADAGEEVLPADVGAHQRGELAEDGVAGQ